MPSVSLSVDPDSVSVPPPAEVIATANGGNPPYTLDTKSVPAGVTVQISGSGPQWSVTISGTGSGNVELEVADSSSSTAGASVAVS